MATKLSIISSAFMLLGKEAVNSLGESASPTVKSCALLYDNYYDSLLTLYPWRFAITQFTLNLVASPLTVPNFNYAYQLPSDYLNIIQVDPLTDFAIYEDVLYCNIAQGLKLFYTTRVPEGLLPPYYVVFLIEKFAELFAMRLTENDQLVQLWGDSAQDKLNRAIGLDAMSQPSTVIQDNRVAAAKYGSSIL